MREQTTKTTLIDASLSALFAAIVAVCAWISFMMPSGISFTLQTFGIALCGFFLGTKRGTVSIAVYLLIGLIGVPVFAGFNSGVGAFGGPTGGFLYGFLPFVVLCSLRFKKAWIQWVLSLVGLIVLYLCGTVHFCLLTGMGVVPALMLTVVPYVIKDVASVVLAKLIADRLRKALPV